MPPQAHDLITKMVARSIVLAPYLDGEMVTAICNAMGVPVPRDPTPAAPPSSNNNDEGIVEDDIEEDFD